MTESWVKEEDSSPFSELVPQDWIFHNSPQITRRGGGLAAVFKRKYITRIIQVDVYSSFEVQLFQTDLAHQFYVLLSIALLVLIMSLLIC